ncbi:TetR family transcriptional regulator [Shewanella sp. NFH-SH190041]|uniref:TetR/AcrR family transcriptional regulator n=1 Tax=Shewanella sp. NFH-SH190041 TaxID=2950245 RepID=UPI0021C2F753|nr:TetR/AcrR family transcriptional regulator [Shewanella sp. NFH-SH190041]BDM65533.1 TetR family transcriptional regulator [Shewanella sp. NFH-SH190041]
MADSKKQAILQAALPLFVERGFDATSTAMLAQQAGVATGTLFHHFANKDAVLAALFISTKQEFADHMQAFSPVGEFAQQLQQLWDRAIEWSLANPLKQQFFQHYCLSPALPQALRDRAMFDILGFLAEHLRQGQASGELSHWPLTLLLHYCHGQYLASSQLFVQQPQLWQQADYRLGSFQLLWQAIKA